MPHLPVSRSPRLAVLDERLRELGASIAADREQLRQLKSLLGDPQAARAEERMGWGI